MKEKTLPSSLIRKEVKLNGTANGCVAKVADERCILYTSTGKEALVIDGAKDGMLLNDGSYFVTHRVSKVTKPIWSLFDKDRHLIMTDIEACEVYANGWYRIVKNDRQTLYRDDHKQVAKGFTQCVVFSGGYGLRCNETYYRYADWKLYTPDGQQFCFARDTKAILGNGLVLQLSSSVKEEYALYSPFSDGLLTSNIIAYQTFPNGRFTITLNQPPYGNLCYLKDTDGQSLSIAVQEAQFLPDGHFVQFRQGRPAAIYRSNGLLITEDVWSVEIAGNYYFTEYEGVTTLFNDKGETVGTGHELVSSVDNFTLTANEGTYHLFNQYGEVLTFPEEE